MQEQYSSGLMPCILGTDASFTRNTRTSFIGKSSRVGSEVQSRNNTSFKVRFEYRCQNQADPGNDVSKVLLIIKRCQKGAFYLRT